MGRVGSVGPARQAGLRPGDVIVRFNGETIGGIEDFYRKLWRTTVGEEVTLTILRETRFEAITSVRLTATSSPAGSRSHAAAPAPPSTGPS